MLLIAAETFNETLSAFLNANREGFHLMEVAAAPLLVKRRGMKRKSSGSREQSPRFESTNKKTPLVVGQLESVPEIVPLELTRPCTLALPASTNDYRTLKPFSARDTGDPT